MSAIEVRTIRTEEGWAELAGEWNPLVERSASATVFLTWEWLRAWWASFRREGDELFILAAWEVGGIAESGVRSAESSPRLLGLAPLYRSRVRASHRIGSLRRIGFIGDRSGDSEYLDFAIEPGREPEVVRAFLDAIERDAGGWDLLCFHVVPKSSPSLAVVRELAAERGWLAEEKVVPRLAIRLPGDWESYLATLQPRFRSKLRSLARRLQGDTGKMPVPLPAAFEQCTEPSELPERLESLFALHQARWRAAGKPGAFADPARRRFYREVGEAFLRRGWLRFWSLRLGGRYAAHEFSFEHLGRVYFLQQAFDIGSAEQNAGTALKAHVLRDSIARGAREYDFLAGAAPYKEKWGAERSECVLLTLGRPAAPARLHLGLRRLVARLRDGARAITPAPLLRLKRGVQQWLRHRGMQSSHAEAAEKKAGGAEIGNRKSEIGNHLRVALVNRFFWRAGAVPSVVREWAEHLEKAGHEVVVFASDVDAAQSSGRRTYVPVRMGGKRAFDWAGWVFAWNVRKALRRQEPAPDVVLSTDSTGYFGAWRACRRRGIPAIMAFQGWVYSPGKRGLYPRTVTWAYKLAVHFCARHAPLIACISPEIEEGLRGLGVPAQRLWYAPNCVDLAAWESGKAGAHRREARRLLFVGRFSPEKGVPHLLEAMRVVLECFPETRLDLVGGEEAEDGEVHRLCRELGVAERVAFRGVVPREALRPLYAEADLLAVPSLAEGHPLAPLESLACGTPVVASALPGIRATIEEGVNGLLVPPGDSAALAEALVRVLGDEALLDKMSRAARPSVERFSWAARVRELEAIVAARGVRHAK